MLTALVVGAAPATAQTFTAGADLLFYGDNTEFANPFRSGDTTLGISGTVFVEAALNEHVTLRGGMFGLGRFGSHEFLEHAEPAVSLQIARGTQRFVFGSLQTVQTRQDVAGPERETLHHLLPIIQREDLTFSRGQEMGMQWLIAGPRLDHDAWINWQRLNTATHRERFDAGYRAALRMAPAWRLHGQWHIVHEGGQRFGRGAVRDSQAVALGLEWLETTGRWQPQADVHIVGTRDVPDREQPALTEGGVGVLARTAVGRGPWRGHVVVWRGRDTLKEEGDANYLSLRQDGALARGIRDYGEVGLTRHFRPAPGVHLMASVRLHRTESHYEYSYRVVGRVRVRQRLSRTP